MKNTYIARNKLAWLIGQPKHGSGILCTLAIPRIYNAKIGRTLTSPHARASVTILARLNLTTVCRQAISNHDGKRVNPISDWVGTVGLQETSNTHANTSDIKQCRCAAPVFMYHKYRTACNWGSLGEVGSRVGEFSCC